MPSKIPPQFPRGCSVTFAQVLSRHGARDPTASKTVLYNDTIQRLQTSVDRFTDEYAFLADYEYTLGADLLTAFGQQQLVSSGTKFYNRYKQLSGNDIPFIRSSGQDRVVDSAQHWVQGFRDAKSADRSAEHGEHAYPVVNVIIPEKVVGINNTLNHNMCTKFEADDSIARDAESAWADIFIPPIRERLNAGMPGANVSKEETIYMMELCPYETVASPTGAISPFCALFTEAEWHQYGYYETLNKWYGFSHGNPLGSTQGVGFVNELIARMTGQPVHDHTSTNRTLDGSQETFPLGRQLYGDFSHDNDLTAIFSALGLYNDTAQFSETSIVEATEAGGYSAAWTVPFAARAYFEKMRCPEQGEELVRVIVNDRVQPLSQCGSDRHGRCSLSAFIKSLGFAKQGGHWDQCFTKP